MKSVLRAVKNHAYSYNAIEIKVREATSNSDVPAPMSLLREIARSTHDTQDYPHLLNMIWQRLADMEQPKHITKAITLVEYLLYHGSQRFVEDVKRRKKDINALTQYKHYDEHNYDDAKDARMIAKRVSGILSDEYSLDDAREQRINNKRITSTRRQQEQHNEKEIDKNEMNMNVNNDMLIESRSRRRVLDDVTGSSRYIERDSRDLDVVSEEEMDEPRTIKRTNTRTTIRQSSEIYEPDQAHETSKRERERARHGISSHNQDMNMNESHPSHTRSRPDSHIVQQLDLLSLNDPHQPVQSSYHNIPDLLSSSLPSQSIPSKHVTPKAATQSRKAALLAELAALEHNDDDVVDEPISLQSRQSDVRPASRSYVPSQHVADPLWSNSLVSLSPAGAASIDRRVPAMNTNGTSMAELRRSRPLPSSAASTQLIHDFAQQGATRKQQRMEHMNPNDIFFNK